MKVKKQPKVVRKPGIKLWVPLSGIPGVSDEMVRRDNDREVRAERSK